MGEIRQLKKGLIFLLTFLLDQYQEISVRNLYRAFYLPGYSGKRQSLYELASRLVKVGEIEKIIKNGEIYLKLTSQGGSFFDELISLKKLSEKNWDGFWRLVIFDISEIDRKTRDFIRRRLKEWGFVMWQESVYISPHPLEKEIDEFLKTKKLFPKVVCLKAKNIGIKNEKKFAWVVFKLGRLEKLYQRLEEKIDNLLKKQKDNNKDKFNEEVRNVFINFEEAVLQDPFLPKKLAPDGWRRETIKRKLLFLISGK